MRSDLPARQKHFKLCKIRVPTAPLLKELEVLNSCWDDARARAIPLHRHTRSIHLKVADCTKGGSNNWCQKDRKTPHYDTLPSLAAFLEGFAEEVGGCLSRVNIVTLKPGSAVYPHRDVGGYYAIRDRYHLVLKSPEGSHMKVGDEESVWKEGEVWWFDNKKKHEAFNPSDRSDRIHVIFDILPRNPSFAKAALKLLGQIFTQSSR